MRGIWQKIIMGNTNLWINTKFIQMRNPTIPQITMKETGKEVKFLSPKRCQEITLLALGEKSHLVIMTILRGSHFNSSINQRCNGNKHLENAFEKHHHIYTYTTVHVLITKDIIDKIMKRWPWLDEFWLCIPKANKKSYKSLDRKKWNLKRIILSLKDHDFSSTIISSPKKEY